MSGLIPWRCMCARICRACCHWDPVSSSIAAWQLTQSGFSPRERIAVKSCSGRWEQSFVLGRFEPLGYELCRQHEIDVHLMFYFASIHSLVGAHDTILKTWSQCADLNLIFLFEAIINGTDVYTQDQDVCIGELAFSIFVCVYGMWTSAAASCIFHACALYLTRTDDEEHEVSAKYMKIVWTSSTKKASM